jgi:epsilon-lactone hydrolase
VRMARGMRAAGCRVTLEIWPRMPHVWHLFAPIMPEARRAIDRIGTFMIGATRPPHPSPAERKGSRQPAEFAAAR